MTGTGGTPRSSVGRPRLASRGRVVLRLAPGRSPDRIHSHRDIAVGAGVPSSHVDRGPVDQAIRRVSSGMLAARAYHAAAHLDRPGQGHLDYDGLEESLGFSRTFRVQVDPDASLDDLVKSLLDLDGVEMATPLYWCELPFVAPGLASPQGGARLLAERRAPSAGAITPYQMVGADEALAMEAGDPAVLVGLVDSGVALGHPELAGRIRPGVDTVDLVPTEMPAGLTLVAARGRNRRRHPEDQQGHGTACASIIAAQGVAMHRGLGNGSSVIPAKALAAVKTAERDELTAVGTLVDIDEAMKTAIDLGAHVLNLSFGTPESAIDKDNPVPHVELVRYALARGCVLVAASGNEGDFTRYFPSCLPGVIAVGSVGADLRPSHFSSRGDHVALCAPGEAIPVAGLDGYGEVSGTSFAAPFVAATCALMIARGLRYSTPLAPETVRRLLVESASAFATGTDARGCGAGILSAPAALRAVDAACSISTADEIGDAVASENRLGARSINPNVERMTPFSL
jgi:subtilisin family serine protease